MPYTPQTSQSQTPQQIQPTNFQSSVQPQAIYQAPFQAYAPAIYAAHFLQPQQIPGLHTIAQPTATPSSTQNSSW